MIWVLVFVQADMVQNMLLQAVDLLISFFTYSLGNLSRIEKVWVTVRGNVMAPTMRVAVTVCLLMSAMLVAEKLLMGLVSLLAKVFRWRPERRYKCEPLRADDEELGNLVFPMVLVQVPMYNERQVMYQVQLSN